MHLGAIPHRTSLQKVSMRPLLNSNHKKLNRRCSWDVTNARSLVPVTAKLFQHIFCTKYSSKIVHTNEAPKKAMTDAKERAFVTPYAVAAINSLQSCLAQLLAN